MVTSACLEFGVATLRLERRGQEVTGTIMYHPSVEKRATRALTLGDYRSGVHVPATVAKLMIALFPSATLDVGDVPYLSARQELMTIIPMFFSEGVHNS